MKIGIPQGLLYYSYYPMWKKFFQELGAEVITSGNTNKTIFDLGVKLCVDEACLPVKVYHGHVKSLCDKVDAIFIPRIMSVCKNEYICPKFCGLPEMIKNSVPGMPYMIDTTINLRKGNKSIIDSAVDAAGMITRDKRSIINAFNMAAHEQMQYDAGLKRGIGLNSPARSQYAHTGRIALLGHPYNIYDSFINMNIIRKIRDMGYDVVTAEMMDEERINKSAACFPKRHFWTLGRIVLGAGMSFVEEHDVDGIIYLSSFGCGIDSMMEDYLVRHIHRECRIPYMKLVLDEHTGEAGMDTRLEAFIDMVKWRDNHEGNISPYGSGICSSKGIS